VLRYQGGLFLPEHGLSTIERAARDAEAEQTIMTIGKKLQARGQEFSPMPQAHTYAPTVIVRDVDAKGFKKAELVAAFDRLLDQHKVEIETVKPGTSREKRVIRFGLARE
jgi:glycine cleavage system regulatory protein